MVQGFNHNIKHKGKLFHIQTEDSGRDNPHIITHVFVGGNILASKKTSYADIVKADRLEQIVRELMEEQHKSVLRNLINGVYDQGAPAADAEPKAPATATASPFAAGSEEPSKTKITGSSKPAGPVAPVVPMKPAAAAAPKPPVAGAGEKSLDEIILSYLADRDE